MRLYCLLAGLALVAASACTAPPEQAAAPIWQPQVGDCHDGFTYYLFAEVYEEKSCTDTHVYETVHVGEFTGHTAQAAAAPRTPSDEYGQAWRDCDVRLTQYFGGQWRDRKMRLRVGMPRSKAWVEGARWYSCEAAVGYLHGAMSTVASSFKGGFHLLPELEYGCADVPASGHVTTPRSCDEPHNAEYAGHFTLESESYDEMLARLDSKDAVRACKAEIARVVGNPNLGSGWWIMPPNREDWLAGDRDVRCFAWFGEDPVSGSIKGAVGAASGGRV